MTVIRALPTIVAFLATPEASVRLDHLSLTRRNLLSLRLLHLLNRCTVLSRWCLARRLRLTGRLSIQRVVGHPPANLHLLSLWVTRRSSDPLLALPLSLRVTLKSLHDDINAQRSDSFMYTAPFARCKRGRGRNGPSSSHQCPHGFQHTM
jgi:hypothetical protein